MTLLDQLHDRSVHLVGISSLEIADVACFLGRRGANRLVGHDLCESDALWEHFRAAHIGMAKEARQAHWDALVELELPMRLGGDYLSGIDEADVVIVSQAWRLYPRNEPLERLRRAAAVRFVTPVEIYLEIAAARGIRTVGITGSNGKSTTTNMVAATLGASGQPHILAGNYRYRGPILEALADLDAEGVLVLELSNHHLLAVEHGVDVAVVTNVTPNHLGEHEGLDGYVAAKRRLAECQSTDGVLILNDDDAISREFSSVAHGAVLRFSLRRDDVDGFVERQTLWLRDSQEPVRLVAADELKVLGTHNVQNALSAALAARAAGVAMTAIAEGLVAFEGAPGRLELVRTVGAVRLIWDIESTTPESTIKGLEAFEPGTVHLIAGGDNKGLAYGQMIEAAKARQARVTLLGGSATDVMVEASGEIGWPAERAATLEEAVVAAFSTARSGDVVLVSPGAKGFYNQHVLGKPSFKRLVKRLRGSQRGAALNLEEDR